MTGAAVINSLQDRVDRTVKVFEDHVRRHGLWMSVDGRVGEADAAMLIGLAERTLRRQRQDGVGPPAYDCGGNGNRVSYRIVDLALWIENKFIEPATTGHKWP